ncbi:MAG TPA: flagellar biosynthetic protein FliR [Microthrixaceae bacterium]|nr:flagellar biosynthetic protein FliR [Microthrixaceae bacterium]
MASTRIIAFLLVAPPFAGGGVPVRIKVGLSAGLALVVTPRLALTVGEIDTAAVIGGIVYQAAMGLALGFIVMLLFSAVQAAGQLIDFSSALSSAAVFDPFAQTGLSPMARIYQMLATLLLFTSGGYLLFIGGLLRSFDAAPMSGFHIDKISEVMVEGLGNFFVAALQIGLPLLAALFMAELLLGLLAKAAPQMNMLVLGFGTKSMILLGFGGLALAMLPRAVEMIVDMSIRGMSAIVG